MLVGCIKELITLNFESGAWDSPWEDDKELRGDIYPDGEGGYVAWVKFQTVYFPVSSQRTNNKSYRTIDSATKDLQSMGIIHVSIKSEVA